MSETGDITDARSPLAPGTRVEVQTGFDGSWSTGFVVEDHTAPGYRLRRQSDDVGARPRSVDRRSAGSATAPWW
ncbi:MAG: hypothetical protein WKF43_17935 [Acidimicrobiales bacterium]